MPIDSQRAPRGQPAPADDAWLSPVLVANGVLTPLQAERLRSRKGLSLWAAAVAEGATDEAIVAAVARAYRMAVADLGAAGSSAAYSSATDSKWSRPATASMPWRWWNRGA
jgi:hypothetical protein